jgi:predicted nucleic acid-binding protein
MILADTSVWIDHFRGQVPGFSPALTDKKIVLHPMVLGELSLGTLPHRKEALYNLALLPMTFSATDQEALEFVEIHHLYNFGIGWVDAHLLLSCRLEGHILWTHDRNLSSMARACGIKLKSAD